MHCNFITCSNCWSFGLILAVLLVLGAQWFLSLTVHFYLFLFWFPAVSVALWHCSLLTSCFFVTIPPLCWLFSFLTSSWFALPVSFLVWRNSTNTWFWCMQRIFLSFLDIFDLLNPNPNDASVYMLSVLRFGWKMQFLVKKYVFSMFQSFYTFFLFRCVLIITL